MTLHTIPKKYCLMFWQVKKKNLALSALNIQVKFYIIVKNKNKTQIGKTLQVKAAKCGNIFTMKSLFCNDVVPETKCVKKKCISAF